VEVSKIFSRITIRSFPSSVFFFFFVLNSPVCTPKRFYGSFSFLCPLSFFFPNFALVCTFVLIRCVFWRSSYTFFCPGCFMFRVSTPRVDFAAVFGLGVPFCVFSFLVTAHLCKRHPTLALGLFPFLLFTPWLNIVRIFFFAFPLFLRPTNFSIRFPVRCFVCESWEMWWSPVSWLSALPL